MKPERQGAELVATVTEPLRLTIEQLARRVGMTTRNIRAYQTRGLLPPPRRSGRAGWYGREHVDRLRLIRRLRNERLNLEAISLVLGETSVASGPAASALRRAVVEPFATEDPVELPADEVERRLGGHVDPDVVAKAAALGVVELVADGRVRVLLPSVVRSAEALVGLGVPLEDQIDVVAKVDAASRAVADAYLELARAHLVAILAERADSADPAALRQAVEALRTIAGDVLITLFHRAMTDAADGVVADMLEEP